MSGGFQNFRNSVLILSQNLLATLKNETQVSKSNSNLFTYFRQFFFLNEVLTDLEFTEAGLQVREICVPLPPEFGD